MKCAVVLILLLGLVSYGVCITCYECNSSVNPICGEKVLPDSMKRNCSQEMGVTHTLCRKIVQHVEHEVNGILPPSRIIRTCGWDDSRYKSSCYHRSGFGGKHEVCSCTTDLCNDAYALVSLPLIPSVILGFLTLLIFK